MVYRRNFYRTFVLLLCSQKRNGAELTAVYSFGTSLRFSRRCRHLCNTSCLVYLPYIRAPPSSVEISARKENEGGKEYKISKQQKAAGRGRRKWEQEVWETR